MSVEIDKRVVEMQFDNKQFERNVQTSLGTIEKLKMALNFDGAKGLDSITKAANKIDLSNMSTQAERVQVSFSALQVAGMTMVSELTKSFMNFGKNLWNMSFGQIKSGGMARSLKIEQADFKMKALVEKMDRFKDDSAGAAKYIKEMGNSINWAVDGTAYGYDSAASVAAQLMASGLNDVDQMANDLRAVAGAASMTGRSYDDMGRIFAAVAGQGKLMGDQLLQFSTSGINAAATIAEYLHKTEGEVRQMVSKGQIDFRTFADAMSYAFSKSAGEADKTFSGVTSNVRAQLSRIGQLFAEPYIKHMIPLFQKVKAALKQLRSALVPTSERFDKIFGRLTTWGSTLIESMDFSRLDVIVRGVENILTGLVGVIYTIHQAFREVFDKKSADELRQIAWNFERLTEALLPSREVLDGIKTAFKFLFSLLRVGFNILTSLKAAFKPILLSLARVLGAIISLVRHVEPFVNSIISFLKESQFLEVSMEIIANIIVAICDGLMVLISILDDLFGEFVKIETFKRIGKVLKDISNVLSSVIVVSLLMVYAVVRKVMSLIDPQKIYDIAKGIKNVFGFIFNFIVAGVNTVIELVHGFLNSDLLLAKLITGFKEIFGLFSDIAKGEDIEDRLNNIKKVFGELSQSFAKFADDFKAKMKEINAGKLLLFGFAIGAILLVFNLNKLIEALTKFTGAATKTVSIGSDLSRALQNVAQFSPAMQILLGFAIAIGAVTSALVTLSNDTDPEKLKNSAMVLGVFAGGLLAAAVAITLVNKKLGGTAGISTVAFDMVAVAGSLLLLVFAVRAMAHLTTDISNLLSVTSSVVLIMVGLAGSVAIMAKLAPEFQASMWSILAFATGTLILVKALDMLRSFDISAIWKQALLLGGLMVALGVAVGLASRAARASTVFKNDKAGTTSTYKRGSVGGSLLAFALSMKILLDVFQDICSIPIKQLEAGLNNIKKLMLSFMPLIVSLAIINKVSGSSGEFIADVSKMFASLSVALLIIFGAVALFSALPEKDLEKSVNAMAVIMDHLGSLMMNIMLIPLLISGFSALAQAKTGKQVNTGTGNIFTNLKGIILSLSVLLLAIGGLCLMVKDIPTNAIDNVTQLLFVVGAMVAGIEWLSKFTAGAKAGPIVASLFMIIAIVGAMAFLATAIAFGGVDIEIFMGIAMMMSLAFISIGLMFSGMSELQKETPANTKTDSSGMLPAMVLILGLIGGMVAIVKFAKDVEMGTMIAIFAGMTAVMAMIAGVILALKSVRVQEYARLAESMKIIYPAIALFGTMVASFIALALVLNKVSADAWGRALITIGLISLLMLTMGVVLDKAAENAGYLNDADGIMSTMWTMVLMVSVLGLVIAGIAAIPTSNGYVAKLVALGAVMAALLLFLDRYDFAVQSEEQMRHMKAFAKSFAIMCAGILAIAGAIVLVTKADFSEGSMWGAKLGILAVGIALIGGMLILVTKYAHVDDAIKMGALAGSFVAMCLGLVIIAEAITKIAAIPVQALDQASAVLLKFVAIFGLIVLVAAALGAIPGVGTGVSVAIVAVGGAFLLLGLTLLTAAKAVDIFANAMHKFAALTVDDIDQIADNIEEFLSRLPGLVYSLEQNGHDFARAIALTIIYAADAVGMAAGAIVGAAVQLVVSFCAGILEALPTILDTIGDVLQAIADWLMGPGKEVLYSTGKALVEGFLAIAQGLVDGLFEYFGVKINDLFSAMKDAKQAIENAENTKNVASSRMAQHMADEFHRMVTTEDGTAYAQKVWRFYDMMQERIDAGVISYEEAVQTMHDVGLNQYAGYLNEAHVMNTYYDEEAKDALRRYEANVSEEGRIYANEIKTQFEEAKEAGDGMLDPHIATSFISKLNEGIRKGTISYRYAMKLLYDEGLEAYAEQLEYGTYSNIGSDVSAQLAEGTESNVDKVEDAVDEVASAYEDGAERIKDASKDADEAASGFGGGAGGGKKTGVAYAMQGLDLNKAAQLRKLTQSGAFGEMIGTDLAEGASEAFTDETEKTNFVLDAINKYGPMMKPLGLDLGEFLGNGLIESFSSKSDVIGAILGGLQSAVTGEDFKTTDQWRAYYSEMVPITKEINGVMQTVGTTARWRAEQFKTLEDAVSSKSSYGYDWLKSITGWTDDDGSEDTENIIDQNNKLADSLNTAGDAAEEAKNRIENLKNTVAGALDIFTEFNKETELTGRQVLKTFMGQLDGVTEWTEMLAGLTAKGVAQPIVSMLEESGPSSYERVNAIYKMSTKEIALLNAMYHDSVIMADKSIDVIEKRVTEGIKAGSDKIALWPETVEEFDEQFQKSGDIVAENMVEGIIGSAAIAGAGGEVVELLSESAIEEVPEFRDAFEYLGKAAIEALRKELEFEQALDDVAKFRDELSKTISGAMSIFDEVKDEEEISANQMIYNMTQQVKKVGRWATNLSTLASRGMSEGLLNQLKDLGPAGAAKVEAFVRMSAAQLQRANSIFDSSSKVGNYAADKLVSSYARAGYQTSLGFSEGIDAEAAERAMYELGEKSLTSLQEALDIHSPSRKTYDLGVNTILGYSEGIKDQAATDELMMTIADFGLKIGEAYKEATSDKYLDDKIYLDQGVYEPVIRPLVDMSGVEAGINSFFANRQFSLSGTIGNAMAAQNKGPSVDAIMITTAVKELGSRVDRLNNSVNELRQGQAETRNAIRGIDIRLDTGALVGGIVNQMDSALGSKAVRVKRRKG